MSRKITVVIVSAVLIVGVIWLGNSSPQAGAMVPENEAAVLRGGVCTYFQQVKCPAGTYKNQAGVDCTIAKTLYNAATGGTKYENTGFDYCCGDATGCLIYDKVKESNCGTTSGP